MIPGIRDTLFQTRQRAKFFYHRNKVDLLRINLGGLRDAAFINLDRNLYEREPCKIKINKIIKHLELVNLDSTRASIIFVNYSTIQYFRPIIDFLYNNFRGIYIIDTQDKSISKRPSWINKDSTWAAPHIRTPDLSDGILLPVGLEERRRGTNNKPHFFDSKVFKSKDILVGPFGPTHASREVFRRWKSDTVIEVMTDRLRPAEYAVVASQFKFVICPRGNGIDTHRIWESLWRGSIPIVLRTPWSIHLNQLGIPLYLVDSFEQLYDEKSSDIQSRYLILRKQLDINFSILTNSYWISRLFRLHYQK